MKIEELEKLKDENEIFEKAMTTEDDAIKLQVINNLLKNNFKKTKLALTIKDEELRLKASESLFGREEILKTIQSSSIRERILKNEINSQRLYTLAEMWGIEELQEECLAVWNSDMEKQIELLNSTKYNAIKIYILETAVKHSQEEVRKILPRIMQSLNDEGLIETLEFVAESGEYDEIIEMCLNDATVFERIVNTTRDYYEIDNIISKMNKDIKYEFFKERIKNEGNSSVLNSYLYHTPYETIVSEIENIMEISGVSEEDIPHKKELVMQMYATNNDVIRKINYKLLDDKYIEKLGLDKINLISCYPEIQDRIAELSDKKLDVLVKCIDDYMEDAQTEEWTTIAEDILENLCNNEYDELIEDIEDLDSVNINLLKGILQSKNIFEIKSKDDIIHFEEIKKQKTDKLIKSEDIRDKKTAVLEKAFGQDYSHLQSLLYMYGQNIDLLPESDIKYYIKSLKAINDCQEGDILEQIYEECKETTFIDKAMTERALKTEFGKMYNEGLLKVENLEEIGDNMYSAGTDFRMIITSLGACVDSEYTSNYKDDWNRPFINSQTVSGSYIRNDMLGTAARPRLCYGFEEMEADSLMDSGSSDIGSGTESFKSGSTGTCFLTPNAQINNTTYYNEMDYRRIQNGEKKQPSYIVVFKIDGEIEHLENAKKAQKDWDGLPIVVVDVNACIKSEKAKVDAMIQEYEISKNTELAMEIYYKIRNNRQTYIKFCKDIDIEAFRANEQNMENNQQQENEVTEEELKQNYELVTPQERKQEMGKLKRIFMKIKEIEQEDR